MRFVCGLSILSAPRVFAVCTPRKYTTRYRDSGRMAPLLAFQAVWTRAASRCRYPFQEFRYPVESVCPWHARAPAIRFNSSSFGAVIQQADSRGAQAEVSLEFLRQPAPACAQGRRSTGSARNILRRRQLPGVRRVLAPRTGRAFYSDETRDDSAGVSSTLSRCRCFEYHSRSVPQATMTPAGLLRSRSAPRTGFAEAFRGI